MPRLSALVLAATLIICAGAGVPAQSASSQKPVTLKMENADLRLALQQLFKSVGQNYTLSQRVKGIVTVNLTDVPFRTALDSLLRSAAATQPLTYRVEDGIYVIYPKGGDEVTEVPTQEQRSGPAIRVVKMAVNFVPATVAALQVQPFLGPRRLIVRANSPDNSILAHGNDEDLQWLKQALNLIDVQPKTVLIKAEAILVVNGRKGDPGRFVLASHARTAGDQPVHMSAETTGQPQSATATTVKSGLSDVIVTSRINGDGTITLDTTWRIDFQCRVPGNPNALRIHNTYKTTATVRNGDTANVTGSVTKSGGKTNGSDAEVLLFLTPTIQADRPPSGGVRQAGYSRPRLDDSARAELRR